MVEVAFEYKKLFKGATMEQVFDAILEWLQKKGAKIKKTERPTLIETVYGRADVEWNWDKELKRTVDFELVATKDYVGLSVFQAPVRRTEKRVLESPFQANITWRDWLNECWDYVGGRLGPVEAPRGAPMRIPTAKAAGEGGKAPPPPPQAPPPPPKPEQAPPPKPKPAEKPEKTEGEGSE